MPAIAMADPDINPLPPSAGANPAPSESNPAPAVPETITPSNQGAGAIPDPPSNEWRANPWTPNAPSDYVPTAPIYNQGTTGGGWGAMTGPVTQAPTILDTVFTKPAPPMILPEPGIIRVGSRQWVKPPWITMAEMNSINRWSAYIESRIAQYWLNQINPATGKPFTQSEADRRAASMVVGGLAGGAVGGAAGFAIGVVPGAAVGGVAGAGVGALAGAGIGAGVVAAGLAPLNAFLPIAGTGIWVNAVGLGALAGAGTGAAAGAVGGAALGGLIGGTLVGVPGAAIGVGLGSLFGGGDPNQNINQPWLYRNGSGEIVPKDNVLEFDWNGTKSVPQLAGIPDAHVNVAVKDDDTWVVKLGDERWLGATKDQREKYFYGEINKSLPGAGDATRTFLEDKNGVFQNTVRDLMGQAAKKDPKHTEYNPAGDIADVAARALRVPYGYSSTPDPWDAPRYKDANDPKAAGGAENTGVAPAPPTDDKGRAVPGAPVPQAQPQVEQAAAPAPVTAAAQVAAPAPEPQYSAPAPVAPAPEPVQQAVTQAVASAPPQVQKTVTDAVDNAPAPIRDAVKGFIPGIVGSHR